MSRQYSWRRMIRAPSLAPQRMSCAPLGHKAGTPEATMSPYTATHAMTRIGVIKRCGVAEKRARRNSTRSVLRDRTDADAGVAADRSTEPADAISQATGLEPDCCAGAG